MPPLDLGEPGERLAFEKRIRHSQRQDMLEAIATIRVFNPVPVTDLDIRQDIAVDKIIFDLDKGVIMAQSNGEGVNDGNLRGRREDP